MVLLWALDEVLLRLGGGIWESLLPQGWSWPPGVLSTHSQCPHFPLAPAAPGPPTLPSSTPHPTSDVIG